jgi:hypothetical protein
MKIHQKAGPNPHSKRHELAELLHRLIDHCGNPARLIELYYASPVDSQRSTYRWVRLARSTGYLSRVLSRNEGRSWKLILT